MRRSAPQKTTRVWLAVWWRRVRASQRGHTRLLQALHPFTALAEIFEDDRPDERVIGVPSLVELAAMVSRGANRRAPLASMPCVSSSLPWESPPD